MVRCVLTSIGATGVIHHFPEILRSLANTPPVIDNTANVDLTSGVGQPEVADFV